MSNILLPDRPQLPEWQVSTWLNAPAPISLVSLRGKVVLLHAFQMLCPGCVAHGLPQTQRVRRTFPESEVAVIGLHTVFEHHAVMTVAALRAFVHEYRWTFPIGVDRPDGADGLPVTMARYGLRGTPTLLLLDHQGRVCLHHFGQIDDLALGAVIGGLVAEAGKAHLVGDTVVAAAATGPDSDSGVCPAAGCGR